MRLSFLASSLMTCALLIGCASPVWHNPEVGDSSQQAGQFEVDHNDCDIEARDKYPIDKDGQIRVYDMCMEKKGWSKRDGTHSVNFR